MYTAKFLCSLNKKFTQEEVISFEIDVPIYYGEDPHDIYVKVRAQNAGCDAKEKLGEYANFASSGMYWMDAVCLEEVKN